MSDLVKKSFYMTRRELEKVYAKLELLGFKGRGRVTQLLRKIISPNNQIVFITGKGVKVKIENE